MPEVFTTLEPGAPECANEQIEGPLMVRRAIRDEDGSEREAWFEVESLRC